MTLRLLVVALGGALLVLLASCGPPPLMDYYLADSGNDRLVRMDRFDGRGWRTFGRTGSGRGQFREPSDVTLDPSRYLYVVDRRNKRLVRMSDFGGRGWVTLGGPGQDVFEDPIRVAVHPASHRLYVLDAARDAVYRFDDITGKGRTVFTDHSQVLRGPTDLAFDRYGRLYVACAGSGRLIRFRDPEAAGGAGPWEVYDGAEIPAPFQGLRGLGAVAVAPDGAVYLVLREGDALVRLEEDLSSPQFFGRRGTGPGELYDPRDLTFDREGRLIVTDSGNGRLVRVDDLEGTNWTEFGRSGSGKEQFRRPGSCLWGASLPTVLVPDAPPARAVPGRILLYDPKNPPRPGAGAPTPPPSSGARALPGPPPGVAAGSCLVVSDTGHHRLLFFGQRQGRPVVGSLGQRGSEAGGFDRPRGLAVDLQGRLLVVDAGNGRIVRVDETSGRGWTAFEPRDGHRFVRPEAVAVEPGTGRIFVSDPEAHRLVRMDDLDGSGWTEYGDGGQRFRRPMGLDFDARGRLFVVAAGREPQLVRIDDLQDRTGGTWRYYDGGDLHPMPWFRGGADVAVDRSLGSVFATDPVNDRLVELSGDLQPSAAVGQEGSGRLELREPWGVALGPEGRVAVVDAGNDRIVVTDPGQLAPWWSTDPASPLLAAPSYLRFWKPSTPFPAPEPPRPPLRKGPKASRSR